MPEAGLKELLEAGVHFGHQTRRWNPNMRRYIDSELDGIHVIDLLQTEELLERARVFAGELASGGGTVLFVGTKKQARDAVKEWADRCQMPYVNQRWLGGLLTNFNTMSARIARLRIPIIGLVDTNCDPTPIDYVIPGNDDAIRSCGLIVGTVGRAVETGASAWRVEEDRRKAEEAERRRKDEEERRKREEEERARQEAEAAAKAKAEAEAAQTQASPAAGPVAGEGGALRAGASSTPPSPAPPAEGASKAEGSTSPAKEEGRGS